MKRSSVIFIALILMLALVGFLWNAFQTKAVRSQLTASGTIETTEVEVGSRVGGRVLSVKVQEGDFVHPGDILAELDPYQLPAQKQELASRLAQAEAILSELRHGPRPQEIASAEALYQEAAARANLVSAGSRPEEIAQAAANRRQIEADLAHARTSFQRFQTLYSKHVVTQQEYDQVRSTYESVQQQYEAALQKEKELKNGSRPQEIQAAREQARAQQKQLELLKAGSRSEEIAAQQALVESYRAQLQQLDRAGAELLITATCHCQVSSFGVKPGQLILANQTLATLTDLGDLWVRVYIPEERFGQVQPGDTAVVKVDAFPKNAFSGKVVQLASRAEFTPRNVQTPETRKIQVFGVKVKLDNKDLLLRPGMPADVTFDSALHLSRQ